MINVFIQSHNPVVALAQGLQYNTLQMPNPLASSQLCRSPTIHIWLATLYTNDYFLRADITQSHQTVYNAAFCHIGFYKTAPCAP